MSERETPEGLPEPESHHSPERSDGAAGKRPMVVGVFVAVALASFFFGTCIGGGGEVDEAPQQASGETAEDELWTCAMHLLVRADGPGSCPFCGMDLVPASSIEAGEGGVVLSERARILASIVTAPVRRREVEGSGRELVGRVEIDETRLRTITSWIGGRIDRLHVRATGQKVRRGQVVARLYSPEVYAAHQDLLVAKRQLERLGEASAIARGGAEAALEAARERLRLLGFEGGRLEALENAERPTRSVSIRADAAGTVLERVATQGSYVQPGTPLYRVADLGRVWVQIEAYERDLPLLRVGQKVALTFPSLPNRSIEGEVAFVDPVVDPRRRIAQVRVSVPNDDGALRPGMIGEAVVSTEGSRELTVPATAPLFTGRRSIVYVQVPGDRPTYAPRTVSLGARRGDVYPVLSGLEGDEQVVVHGAFALDAELEIRGGPSMMTRADDSARVLPSDALRAALADAVNAYLDLAEALASDDAGAGRRAADALHQAVTSVDAGEHADAWVPIAEPLTTHAHHVMHAPTIAGMRQGFEPVSSAVRVLLARFGNPTDAPARLTFCPMAFDNRGAHWVQRGDTVRNAYFGDVMLTCGSIEATVEPGEWLEVSP